MNADPFFLLRLSMSMRGLYGLAEDHGLPRSGGDDLGYILHAALAALFGDLRPATFAIETIRSGDLRLLAYSTHALEQLQEHVERYADPAVYSLFNRDRAAEKPMPQRWRAGQRLGFQVRTCPTVRMAKKSPRHAAGAEVDAFVAAAWRVDRAVKVDRERVYQEWLAACFERSGGARLEHATLDGFMLAPQLRRTQGSERKARSGRKPDALMHGALTITDAGRFNALLRRGIGRHRAFGFGMLLLRPEVRPC